MSSQLQAGWEVMFPIGIVLAGTLGVLFWTLRGIFVRYDDEITWE